MASRLPDAFQDAVRALSRLPGVGERTATRYVFKLLEEPERARALAAVLERLSERVRPCAICGNLADEPSAPDPGPGPPGPRCPVCADPARDPTVVCVVESVPHLHALERSGAFRGRYHVLGGTLSPVRGVGPEQLRVGALVERVRTTGVTEVIAATDADVAGDATAAYLADVLEPLGVRVSRLATGVPMGSDLEYLDATTLSRALAGRR